MNTLYTEPKEHYLSLPQDQSCYEYVQECAAKIIADHGDYTAIVNNDNKISVKRLFRDVEQLAAFLADSGIKKGDVYTVFLPTCVHAFTAFYALSKLGVIAHFIHPMTPPGALEEIMNHTGSKGIFILDMFAPKFPNIMSKYQCIFCSPYDYIGESFPPAKPSDAANIHIYADIMTKSYPAVETVSSPGKQTAVYLSGGGTTGQSKTIKLSSYAFNSAAYETYLLDAPHKYCTLYSLCALPCFHAYGLGLAMHYAVCNAYSCILMPVFDAEKANDILRKYPVALILGVPNMFKKMFSADNFEHEGLRHLRHIDCGGDVVSEEFLDAFNAVIRKHGSKGQLGRGYALTEMCSCCTTSEIYIKENSVGFPYQSIRLKIVDDELNTLPAGEIGEICATGNTIMNGYLPDNNITESGLWKDEHGVNWVRTGDMGYLDEEGYLFFTGRKKRIIIISGYNIYPYSIEEKINSLDYIFESCAVQGYDEDCKPFVKLYVVLNDKSLDSDNVIAKLNEFCEYNLDGISRPRHIEIIDALPRTKMDKIDFMALTDPYPVAKAN